MAETTKFRREPALQPLRQRPILGDKQFDPTRECWTITRDDGRGKIHIAYVPWLPLTACHHRFIIEPHRLVAEWMRVPLWGNDAPVKFCTTCRHRVPSLPWEYLLPSGWKPPTDREEAGVIADWWFERGEEARADAIRSWIEKGQL